MPVLDQVQDDGSGIQLLMVLDCPDKSLNLGLNHFLHNLRNILNLDLFGHIQG